LNIVVTGSSALDIYRGRADISRRVILYRMNGLSFREFLELKYMNRYPVINLEEMLNNPAKYIRIILKEIKPVKLFEEYLQRGFYPFFTE
jgi:predicted AAA+ superfamily ATPase